MKPFGHIQALSYLVLALCQNSWAFTQSHSVLSPRRDVSSLSSSSTLLKVQALIKNKESHETNPNRRDALLRSLAVLSIGIETAAAIPLGSGSVANAATDTAVMPMPVSSSPIAKVATWPGIEALEPMYEFKLSTDALQAGVQDSKNWPFVKKRLDKFFKGAILSEKNFYFGVGLQYMNDIKYDTAELPNYVLLDKQTRFDALDRTMKSLEALKNSLAGNNIDPIQVQNNAEDVKLALASWFALVPEKDFKAVEDLFINIRKADINRDGVLSKDELEFLSIEQQELWKKRVDEFG